MNLSSAQLKMLSHLFIDIAKGLFLAAVAVPLLSKDITFFDSFKSIIVGLFFAYLALKAIELSEVNIR